MITKIEFRGERAIVIEDITPEEAIEFIHEMVDRFARWLAGTEAGAIIGRYRWAKFNWATWDDDLNQMIAPEDHVDFYLTKALYLREYLDGYTCKNIAAGLDVPEDSYMNPARISWDPKQQRLLIYDTGTGDPWGRETYLRWIPARYHDLIAA